MIDTGWAGARREERSWLELRRRLRRDETLLPCFEEGALLGRGGGSEVGELVLLRERLPGNYVKPRRWRSSIAASNPRAGCGAELEKV